MQADAALAPNRVREAREELGLSQQELALAVRLSRQSIFAIEAGRATPSVDVALRLAKVLGRSVESLFELAVGPGVVHVEAASAMPQPRLALAHIGGRFVAHALGPDSIRTSADALAGAVGSAEVDLLRPEAAVRGNLLVMGCAAGLGLLTDRLGSLASGPLGGGRFVWLPGSSLQALEALSRSQTHVAGVHLVDGKTRSENVHDVEQNVRGAAVVLVTLGRWEVGLLTAPGSRRVRSAADLRRRGLRLAIREKGSGARRVLERELRAQGARAALASAVAARGHLEVAQAVAFGAADTGVATRDAAIAFGLDFVPLSEERYDLVLRTEMLADLRVQRLLDCLCSAGFRRELSSLGYDASASGARVAELSVA